MDLQSLVDPNSRSTPDSSAKLYLHAYEVRVELDGYERPRHAGVQTLFREGSLCHVKIISARDRADAVHKAANWYWLTYRGKKPIHLVLRVSDPYNEVFFTPSFRCHDRRNKYLPQEIIEQLILESNGRLEPDSKLYSPGSPPAALRWSKRRGNMSETLSNSRNGRRRRDPSPKQIAPCIYRDVKGRIWYLIVTQPQRVMHPYRRNKKAVRLLRKRKKRLVRLEGINIFQVVAEIKRRNLLANNRSREAKRQFEKLVNYISDLQVN